MNFSEALKVLKQGQKVTNKNWDDKNMYIGIQFAEAETKMTRPSR